MNWFWSPNRYVGPWLVDLETDPGESYDVAERYPEVAARLGEELAAWRRGLQRNRPGGK